AGAQDPPAQDSVHMPPSQVVQSLSGRVSASQSLHEVREPSFMKAGQGAAGVGADEGVSKRRTAPSYQPETKMLAPPPARAVIAAEGNMVASGSTARWTTWTAPSLTCTTSRVV